MLEKLIIPWNGRDVEFSVYVVHPQAQIDASESLLSHKTLHSWGVQSNWLATANVKRGRVILSYASTMLIKAKHSHHQTYSANYCY